MSEPDSPIPEEKEQLEEPIEDPRAVQTVVERLPEPQPVQEQEPEPQKKSKKLKLPKKPKAEKKAVPKKEGEKSSFGEKFVRFSLRLMNKPTKLIAPRFPKLRDQILRSSMYTSADILLSLGLLFSLLTVPVAIVGAYVLIHAGLGLFAIAMVAIPPIPFILVISLPRISGVAVLRPWTMSFPISSATLLS